jgi:hypothetical protein
MQIDFLNRFILSFVNVICITQQPWEKPVFVGEKVRYNTSERFSQGGILKLKIKM